MSSSYPGPASDSLDEVIQNKPRGAWAKLLACCCCIPQRRKKTRVVPILKTPKLRPLVVSDNLPRRDKVQIRMSLVEERQLTPVTTGAAYPKPSIDKRRKLMAAAHEFSELMSFNRVEVETEQPAIASKRRLKATKFQLCRIRKSADEKARRERELSERLAALELRLRDLDDEAITSSASGTAVQLVHRVGVRSPEPGDSAPRMSRRGERGKPRRTPGEIGSLRRSTVRRKLEAEQRAEKDDLATKDRTNGSRLPSKIESLSLETSSNDWDSASRSSGRALRNSSGCDSAMNINSSSPPRKAKSKTKHPKKLSNSNQSEIELSSSSSSEGVRAVHDEDQSENTSSST